MIVDAYAHVCPERLMDAISQRHPGAEVAALRRNGYRHDGERRLRYMDRIGEDWPAEALDTIRSLGPAQAGLAAVLSGNLHRIMRL